VQDLVRFRRRECVLFLFEVADQRSFLLEDCGRIFFIAIFSSFVSRKVLVLSQASITDRL
jgi:hypothetical protein